MLIVRNDELNVRNNELSNELNMRNSEDASFGDCRKRHKWISDPVNRLWILDFQGFAGAVQKHLIKIVFVFVCCSLF